MNKIARKYIALFVVCVMALQLISCGVTNHNADQATAVQGTVIEIEKYGHAVLNIQTAEFVASGCELGDVVRVRLGTFEATMPFFDGYYSNPGQLMLRGSAEEDNIAVCINYGDFCGENQVKVGDTVEITLADKAGMRELQELCALKYSNDRVDYTDDVSFANFRVVTAGRIGYGKLYRTASPVNNAHGRAGYANDLIESVDVATVLNLADSVEDIEEYFAEDGFDSAYYRSLYESGRVIALDLTANFYSDDFANALAEGLTFLAINEPPYCIHCTEGKDRAGFTAMLLEALMGATLDEIIQDYMLSFYNYYGITKENEPQRYQTVLEANLMEMLRYVTGAETVAQLEQIPLEPAVTQYLIDAGMTQEDISLLKEKLG